MRIHTCFFAPAAAIVLLGAARLCASPDSYYFEGQYQLPIPAAPGATQGWMSDAVLLVTEHIRISDLDVTVDVTHTNVFDLQLYLESPSGTTILLNMYDYTTDFFTGADYDHTIFDDEATSSIHDGAAPFAGRFRPLDSLTLFDGQDAYGPWHLRIYDAFYYDTGQLNMFGLFITTASTVPMAPAPPAVALVLIGLGMIRRLPTRR
jgi:subtilisin-like proprotein convertase family protein